MLHAPRFDAFLEDHGHPLFEVADVGLHLQDALAAVEIAREERVPILGGDFYVLERGRMRPTYQSWYTDPRVGESGKEFSLRSWENSERSIREFPWSEFTEAMVALVRAR
jgi:hypothetical protein